MEVKKLLKKIQNRLLRLFPVNQPISAADKKLLDKLGRYQTGNITFYNKPLKIVDPLTFKSSYYEIFVNHIYKFISPEKEPVIIDCGANIGLATIYFKMNYPSAQIIAFEPDPAIYKALQANIVSFQYENVTCRNEAVSDRDTTLNFQVEGGHSGMISTNTADKNVVKMKAVRLKSILKTFDRITFLKMDIEGEEINVIPDIADELKKVDYLFLEYHSFIHSEQALDKLLLIIKEAGMRYYIKEAADKTFPFISRELFLNMDMLVNIFCYRSN